VYIKHLLATPPKMFDDPSWIAMPAWNHWSTEYSNRLIQSLRRLLWQNLVKWIESTPVHVNRQIQKLSWIVYHHGIKLPHVQIHGQCQCLVYSVRPFDGRMKEVQQRRLGLPQSGKLM